MVEKNPNATTQLPISTQIEKVLMHGTVAQFKDAIKGLLEEVMFNELEMQLLDRFLETPQDCPEKVTDLLNKVKKRI